MFTYSPQEKIKMTLFKSLHTLNSLYCVVTWMIHSCVFLFSDSCSWVPLSWTVKLPAVLWKNPSVPTNYLVFQHFCAFEPFPTMTLWFWDPSFHTEDNWRTHLQLLQKIQTLTDAPEEEKKCIKSQGFRMKMCIFSMFCLNIIFFSFSNALQKLLKILICFSEEKLS